MRRVKMLLLLTVLSVGIVSAASYLRSSNAAASGRYFDYVVTILMENNDLQSVLSQGTFQSSLASQYTLSTGYSGVDHPSEPNYVALIGGSTLGVSGDGVCCYGVQGSNLVDRLESGGVTWKAFAEDSSGSGACSFRPPREGDHFAFIVFSDMNTPARCTNFQSTSSSADSEFVSYLNSASPANYIWLTPNDRDNSHSSPISTGDAYLAALVPQILSSNLFRNQRAALFIVYDEGNDVSCAGGGSDCIYASWSGPVAKRGFSSASAYTHYSYLHTIEDNWGLQSLTLNDGSAAIMSEFFASSGSSPLSTSFTVSPSPAQAGQSVTFTASTFGGTAPYSETWSFGDGSSGTGSSVTHAYSGTGTFQVTLTTQDSANPAKSVTSRRPIVVNPAPLPGGLTITFSNTPSNPSVGQTVTFRADVSGGTPPYGVGWDFGDGAISVGTSTTHTFSSAGRFNVTAAVTDSGSPSHSAITSVFVDVGSGGQSSSLLVSFSFQPSNPSVGDTISFTSTVSGGTAPYSYTWDFGDSSGTSVQASPSHNYSASGTFIVSLDVSDSASATDSVSESVTVAAGSPSTGGGNGQPPTGNTNGQYCTSLSSGQSGDLEPIVSVEFVNPANSASFSSNAIFDSGSAYTLAPSSLASSLGLSMSDGTPVTLTTASGGTIQAVVFQLTINFGGTLDVVNVPVAFTDGTSNYLIGRIGFLDQVSVTFDATGQTICLNAGSPGSSDNGGGTCSTWNDDDPDGDADDCGQDGGDTGDSGDSDDADSGDSGSEGFVGLLTNTTWGTMFGVPAMLVMLPMGALSGVAFVRLVRAPRRVVTKKSVRSH